jgi:hypothetical protein
MMKHFVASLLTLLLITATAYAQEAAVNSLSGIGIGTSLEDARSILGRIGTGGGRDTRGGGRKEAWTLKETEFATIAFKSDGTDRIVWISAFIRPGKEVEFTKFGDLAKATSLSTSQAIWNVGSGRGGYRLVAKGIDGRANVVYLLSLDFPEVQ